MIRTTATAPRNRPPRRRPSAFVPLLVATVVASVAFAGCGVVGDGKVARIEAPAGLTESATSTTSTTTAPSTTVNPSTTVVQTEAVRLYYVSAGRVTYVNLSLPTPIDLQVVLTALQMGPPAGTVGLRNAIPGNLDLLVTEDGSGVAQVDLPDQFFDEVAVNDQRLVIAQIVLTLADSRGVGQVVFDQPVPKPLGEVVPAGEPLAYRDYEQLAGTMSLPATATSTVTG